MPCKIDHQGTKRYYDMDGRLHRKNGPAVEYKNGTIEYYLHGKLHRIGAPARIFANGDEVWAQNGLYHREDGPAITHYQTKIIYYFYEGTKVHVSNLTEFKIWVFKKKNPAFK